MHRSALKVSNGGRMRSLRINRADDSDEVVLVPPTKYNYANELTAESDANNVSLNRHSFNAGVNNWQYESPNINAQKTAKSLIDKHKLV